MPGEAGRAFEPNMQDRRAAQVETLAARLAWERGGQTHPLCDYDLDRAEEIITGEKSLRAENVRLRQRVATLECDAAALRLDPTRDDA